MTDWEKLKVVELKEELKSRGVPLTGLKLKQQLIDKLIEIDSANPTENGEHVVENGHTEQVPQSTADVVADEATTTGEQSFQQNATADEAIPENKTNPVSDDSKEENTGPAGSNELLHSSPDVKPAPADETNKLEKDVEFPSEQDTEMKDDDTQGNLNTGEKNAQDGPLAQAGDEMQDENNTIQPAEETQNGSTTTAHVDGVMNTTQDRQQPEPAELIAVSSESTVSAVPEEQRKRKRSTSPAPGAQEIMKKAKANDGEALVIRRESEALEAIQAATRTVQDGRAPNNPDEEPIRPMEASSDPDHTRVAREVGGLPSASEFQDPIQANDTAEPQARGTQSPEPSRYVDPAIHHATSSIYIRNFKRPLHIPTLRSHMSGMAKGPSDNDIDTIKVFYLDMIRTHAFVSFTSISAASRVRNAMHETRFPDEPMREPLWIDFVPDEKVQSWIDQETGSANGSFGGGRSSSRKYEIAYENTRDGIEAVLRDLSQPHNTPSVPQQRSNRVSQDYANTGNTASAIHPDRSGLIPQSSRDRDRDRGYPARAAQSQTLPAPVKPDSGKGFKALDELFSSTTTKPKLYYKPVAQTIASNRLDMLHGIVTGQNDTGRSGDEGMKRYTFEEYRGREEWVDKGPEFGFGRKGQERLEGFRGRGRGTGGFRGRGRGGDSWRGGR